MVNKWSILFFVSSQFLIPKLPCNVSASSSLSTLFEFLNSSEVLSVSSVYFLLYTTTLPDMSTPRSLEQAANSSLQATCSVAVLAGIAHCRAITLHSTSFILVLGCSRSDPVSWRHLALAKRQPVLVMVAGVQTLAVWHCCSLRARLVLGSKRIIPPLVVLLAPGAVNTVTFVDGRFSSRLCIQMLFVHISAKFPTASLI